MSSFLKSTDKYIEISGKLYQLLAVNGSTVFTHDNIAVHYDPMRDGTTLTKEQARASHPEFFV